MLKSLKFPDWFHYSLTVYNGKRHQWITNQWGSLCKFWGLCQVKLKRNDLYQRWNVEEEILYHIIWSNSSAKIVDCPNPSWFSSKLTATTWFLPQLIRNLQVFPFWRIWQSLEHCTLAAFNLTVLGRDNFSADNLPLPPSTTFHAAELVKMSSWNNARGFGPLRDRKITGCQKMSRIFAMQFWENMFLGRVVNEGREIQLKISI